jgi:hypothetical protein
MAALVAKAAMLKTLCPVHYAQQVTSECKAKKLQIKKRTFFCRRGTIIKNNYKKRSGESKGEVPI